MTVKPLVPPPGDIWHRTWWTRYKTANRVAEVRLTWPSLPETGGHTHIPVKCSEANLRQVKNSTLIQEILCSGAHPITPREIQRVSESLEDVYELEPHLAITLQEAFEQSRALRSSNIHSTFNTSSIFLSLISLFSAFQVTVMANQNEIFCSNMEGVVSLGNFLLTHSAFNS